MTKNIALIIILSPFLVGCDISSFSDAYESGAKLIGYETDKARNERLENQRKIEEKREQERKKREQKRREKMKKEEIAKLRNARNSERKNYISLITQQIEPYSQGVELKIKVRNKLLYTDLRITIHYSFKTKSIAHGKVGMGVNDQKTTWSGKSYSGTIEEVVSSGDYEYFKRKINTVQKTSRTTWLGPLFLPLTTQDYDDPMTLPYEVNSLSVSIKSIKVLK
ncbi:WVD2 family protein [Candidatus Thiosymbion oneisti]|uniref:WVD2 family protein n=1 Tax=Candidatus Thiosymbion oneisti TaxID=589554 RepID=UPI001060E35A|nr:WVD2 family protein [Candidatus Thiosymbion oneisti]